MTVFRYIFLKLAKRFLFIFCCLFLVVLLGYSMQQMHKIGGGGVAILKLILPFLVGYVSIYTIPVALLVATTVVYIRMANERELIALQAAGYSKQYLARPALVLAVLLSGVLYYVNNYQLPESRYARHNLQVKELESLLASSSRKQNSLRLKNTVFRYDTIKDGYLRNIQVIEFDDSGTPSVWFSGEKGQFLALPSLDAPYLKFQLTNATVSIWDTDPETPDQAQVMRFQESPFVYRRHMKELLGLKKKELEETTLPELLRLARNQPTSKFVKSHPDYMISLALTKRAAESMAPIAFVFVCVPLSMLVGMSKRWGGMATVILPVLIAYYPLIIFAEQYSEGARSISPLYLFWPPVLLFLISGYFLIQRGN